jgi:hypothetical protein
VRVVASLLELVGAAGVVFGLYLIAPPAAYIVGGLFVVAAAAYVDLKKGGK